MENLFTMSGFESYFVFNDITLSNINRGYSNSEEIILFSFTNLKNINLTNI